MGAWHWGRAAVRHNNPHTMYHRPAHPDPDLSLIPTPRPP